MFNFEIHFSHPWLLLLLIPAVIFTLIPHLRLAKRYRRTRNRITSMVLHLTVMLLSILTLAGMVVNYKEPNEKNELILLVDVSDTQETAQMQRDDFVQTVLLDSKYDGYRVGIVTFGFDQEYVVPLTGKVEGIYDKYVSATNVPDTSATNIAAALTYTKDLFTNKQTAKIVLITDGKQTDADANDVIRSIVAQGTRVDTAYIPSAYDETDVQISGVVLPEYHVNPKEECEIGVTIHSNIEATATIELYDNNKSVYTESYELIEGSKSYPLTHTFDGEGLHELTVSISVHGDPLENNNEYTTYLLLEKYDRILIFEHIDESQKLAQMLNEGKAEEDAYAIDVLNIASESIPQTVEELCQYDQIILNNIAYEDMPTIVYEGENTTYDELLNDYVSEHGGGLFTVGGNDEKDSEVAHAYNRKDMYGTTYQDMLPVQAINYTPPVGVIFIIDRSGSMGGGEIGAENADGSALEWAKGAALTCLEPDVMSERDYVGIMTLDSEYEMILPLTSRTQEDKIRQAIASIKKADGGTEFPDAIYRAGIALRNLKNVDKKHIIIISDCIVGSDQAEYYEPLIKEYYETDGITLSVMGVGLNKNSEHYTQMERAVKLGNGRLMTPTESQLITEMRKELKAEEIKEINYKTYSPYINVATSPLVQGLDRLETNKNQLNVTLDGFYGVKARTTAEVILMGEYDVPIYAQWKYGNGMVGSFMCDLNGQWSSTFMNDEIGQKFIDNVVKNLMPTENIRPNEISVLLKEDNYTNRLSIKANLQEGERLEGSLICMFEGQETQTISLNVASDLTKKDELRNSPVYVTTALDASTNYSRCDFVVKQAGVYKLVLTKFDKDGNAIGTLVDSNGNVRTFESYKSLAYSEEYNVFEEEDEGEVTPQAFLENLAKRGNGAAIEDLENPYEIFEGFVTALNHTFDPRFLFMILALVLFLADVAVRKFKFKWPSELIREYKKRKNEKKEQ